MTSIARRGHSGKAGARLRVLAGAVANEIQPRGNLVLDAYVVALMRAHGVDQIWTRDRDYLKFHDVRVLDPFAPA